MSAIYQVHDSIAVITLSNPPINALGLATRTAAVAGLQQALADPAIAAIVLIGAGSIFCGGADIKEFHGAAGITEPTLHTLIRQFEQSSKPVLAALHGTGMGGGLELALGCHYRIATLGTQLALPEVKIGLLPGAGGTQRLPRAVGLELALTMIVSGAPMAAQKLTGLFDQIIAADADLLSAAITFAGQVAGIRPLPTLRARTVDYPAHVALFDAARAAARRSPFEAPLQCVEAVAASVSLSFEDGLRHELALFMQLLASSQSTALRHIFFAERLASKVADVSSATALRAIHSAAVVGAGMMGAGIAMNFANVGIAVTLLETSQPALEKGLAAIRNNYQTTLNKGKLTQAGFDQRLALISATLSYADIGSADIVVEAVFEEMGVKEAVFRQLDQVMKPGAILASNTSTLDLNQIASFTGRPQDVIGTHFFSPANVMKLLEIVRGSATGQDVLASTLALSKRLKKTGVVAGVCDGFIGNRMIEQYSRQAGFLLEEGALPEQVDRAAQAFGFAMGPFRMGDLAGNDIGWAIRKRRYRDAPHITYSITADVLCEMGRFGQKTGAGWYDYEAGSRTAQASATVNQMIVAQSMRLGVTRRSIDDTEIVERLVYALVNEAALIVDEGIAQRASDIDVVYVAGYGFPLYRGGPMFYADTVGLPQVLASIERFATGLHGEAWTAAPLLRRLAAEGKPFNQT